MTALHSSTADNRDPLTVRTVEEAVTLAPYLLGFQPTESLLMIVADDGAAVFKLHDAGKEFSG